MFRVSKNTRFYVFVIITMLLITGCTTTQGFINKAIENGMAVLKIKRPAYIVSINGYPKNQNFTVLSLSAPDCVKIEYKYIKNKHETKLIRYTQQVSVNSRLESQPQTLFFKVEKGHQYELTANTNARAGFISPPNAYNISKYQRYHTSTKVSGRVWGNIKDIGTGSYIIGVDTPSKLKATSIEDYFLRGQAYIHDRQWEESIADYDKVIETILKNSNESDRYFLRRAFLSRGWAHYKMSRYNKAIDDLSRGIDIDPENARAIYNRGLIYYDNREYEKALADIEKAKFLKWNVPENVLMKMREMVNKIKSHTTSDAFLPPALPIDGTWKIMYSDPEWIIRIKNNKIYSECGGRSQNGTLIGENLKKYSSDEYEALWHSAQSNKYCSKAKIKIRSFGELILRSYNSKTGKIERFRVLKSQYLDKPFDHLKEWETLKKNSTTPYERVLAYSGFLDKYSYSPHSGTVLEKLDSIAKEDWEKVQIIDRIYDYEKFLKRYSNSSFSDKARARIKDLKKGAGRKNR